MLGAACGSSHSSAFDTPADGGGAGQDGSTEDSGLLLNPDAGSFAGDGATARDSGTVTVTTTIYAHTDDTLYTMDPQTKTPTAVGKFAGLGGGTLDTTVTDLAVNGAGEVYVNSESVVYKATVPSAPGTVNLTKLASIAVGTGQRFYALAFAPKGVLGADETLVGGDGAGDVFSIDSTSGATKRLGSFGTDPSTAGNIFALSGDIVFYIDAANKPTGLATIRSCKPAGTGCSKTNDFLAGIDMAALVTAYTSGTPAASLLGGIYGGSATVVGPGVGYGEIFGLGAWQGDVYGFTRNITGAAASPPRLITIDTTSGRGTIVPGSSFSFTNGWSGAGVTTKTVVTIPPPPPPPR